MDNNTSSKQLKAIAREFMHAIQDNNFLLANRIIIANEGLKWSKYLKDYTW